MSHKVIRKRKSYIHIDAKALLDKRLSWQARGVMAYILAQADDSELSLSDLISASLNRRGVVESALKELQSLEYISQEVG